jgi:hypothetical protein
MNLHFFLLLLKRYNKNNVERCLKDIRSSGILRNAQRKL